MNEGNCTAGYMVSPNVIKDGQIVEHCPAKPDWQWIREYGIRLVLQVQNSHKFNGKDAVICGMREVLELCHKIIHQGILTQGFICASYPCVIRDALSSAPTCPHKEEVERLKELREGDSQLVRDFASGVGIEITANNKLPGLQWEQFAGGINKMERQLAQVREVESAVRVLLRTHMGLDHEGMPIIQMGAIPHEYDNDHYVQSWLLLWDKYSPKAKTLAQKE